MTVETRYFLEGEPPGEPQRKRRANLPLRPDSGVQHGFDLGSFCIDVRKDFRQSPTPDVCNSLLQCRFHNLHLFETWVRFVIFTFLRAALPDTCSPVVTRPTGPTSNSNITPCQHLSMRRSIFNYDNKSNPKRYRRASGKLPSTDSRSPSANCRTTGLHCRQALAARAPEARTVDSTSAQTAATSIFARNWCNRLNSPTCARLENTNSGF
jgi:hypothetical protein